MVEAGRPWTVTSVQVDPVFAAVVGFVFGAITASFLCVVAERVPKGHGVGGRSQCACGRQLRNVENLPIVGYLAARGVASCCSTKLPPFYLRAELFLACAWAAAAALGGYSPIASVAVAGIGAAALVAAGVDALDGTAPVDANYGTGTDDSADPQPTTERA